MCIKKNLLLLMLMGTEGLFAQVKVGKVLKDQKDKLKINSPSTPNASMPESNDNTSLKKTAFDGSGCIVKTFAGSGLAIFTENANGHKDGNGKTAQFNKPASITSDEKGNLYVADRANYCIRKISPDGTVTTFAGSTEQDSKNGLGKDARFFDPATIFYDGKGNFFVGETENNAIRKISKEGQVSTVIYGKRYPGYQNGGTGSAQFNGILAVVTNSKGDLLVLDSKNNCIRKISGTEVSTFAGNPEEKGNKDGKALEAQFRSPISMAIDNNDNLYVLEAGKKWVRKITPEGMVSTFDFEHINDGAHPLQDNYTIANFQSVYAGKNGLIYVTDGNARCIHEISADGKNIRYLMTGDYCATAKDSDYHKNHDAKEAVDGEDCKGALISDNLPGLCETAGGEIYFIDGRFCCIRQLNKK